MTTLTQEQLELRRTGITATDIAAIAGLSPWKQGFDVWLEKMDKLTQADSEPMWWGRMLEPLILDAYKRRTGLELEYPGTVRDREHEFILATPDAVVKDDRAVEAKSSGHYNAWRWGIEGSDDIPLEYVAQCAWQMRVLDLPRVDVPVLFGANDFRIYRVHRDVKFEQALIGMGRHFWQRYVVAGKEPEPGSGEGSARYLASQFPKNIKPLRDASEDETILVEKYAHVKKLIKTHEQRRDEIVAQLKKQIGDADGLQGLFGRLTWKTTKSAGVDYKGLCEELGPSEELLQKHTRRGYRRFAYYPKRG
jgi:putative phage-type endonuclease